MKDILDKIDWGSPITSCVTFIVCLYGVCLIMSVIGTEKWYSFPTFLLCVLTGVSSMLYAMWGVDEFLKRKKRGK